MLFLMPNQQCQSTEGRSQCGLAAAEESTSSQFHLVVFMQFLYASRKCGLIKDKSYDGCCRKKTVIVYVNAAMSAKTKVTKT